MERCCWAEGSRGRRHCGWSRTIVDVAPLPVIGAAPQKLRLREFESITIDPNLVLRDGKLDVFGSIRDKGYLRVSIGTGGTTLQARGHVGVIPVNDRLTLEVVPRVPVANLAHLLDVSRQAPFALTDALRLYDSAGELYPSLAGVYATGLRQQIEMIVDRGLLKEYERVEEVTSFPHGRIETGRTMQLMARGQTHEVAIGWFRRTSNTAANRCLKYAVWRLGAYVEQTSGDLSRRQRQRIRRDLNWCWHALGAVELDLSERFLSDRLVTGSQQLPSLRGYYRPALDLALAIIGRQAVIIEGGGDHLRLPSMVVDMSTVFEAYLRETLVRGVAAKGIAAKVLDGNKQPPTGAAGRVFHPPGVYVKATPDIVLTSPQSGAAASVIVEVKYKPADDLPDRDDLNQTITYAAAYGCPEVVIAQPQRDGQKRTTGLHQLGEVGGYRVSYFVFDLAGDLANAESEFVAAIAALV